jgi:DNA-binding NtrC family response regulator
MDRSDLDEISSFSRSVIGQAALGQSLLTVDVTKDPSLSAYESLVLHEIKSILCVPMRTRGNVSGVIYLDTRRGTQLFSDRERAFVESFASQAAIAVENARLFGTMNAENARLQREVEGRSRFRNLIGTSQTLGRLTHVMGSVLESDCNVLVVGESGTGKELVARALHYNGPRHRKKFVPIDCGALPENLLEAELFGYARGAFTGADRDRIGLIEEASGGTLFLDEITNTTTALQARLLRVLQEREIRRLGENTSRPIDIRIVAATNADIRSLMARGHFRQDLYYRLNVVTLDVPPLRERREDIPLLIDHFLNKEVPEGRQARKIVPGIMRALQSHDWPGNVRELQNAVERALVLSAGRSINASDFPDIIFAESPGTAHHSAASALSRKTAEHLMIEEALRRCLGDKAKAARYIGWNRQKLYRRMKSFGIPADYGKAA